MDAQHKYTALYFAVEKNKLQCVKLLIQLGADVTKTDWWRGVPSEEFIQKTPLQRAVDDNRQSIVYYFVKQYEQDISTLDQSYQQKIHAIIEQYEVDELQRHKQVFKKSLEDLVFKKSLEELVQRKFDFEKEWPPMQTSPSKKLLMHYKDMTAEEDINRIKFHKVLHRQGTSAVDELYSSKRKDSSYLKSINTIFAKSDTAYKRIRIDGAPGTGKSMLAKNIALSWVDNEILTTVKALFLISFKIIQNALSVKELFKHITTEYLVDKEITTCSEYFISNNGNQLCILIDDFDDDSATNPFIRDVISGKVLPNALVIVFSQPTCTLNVIPIDKTIEIIGLAKKMRKKIILDSLNNFLELNEYLKNNPLVNEVCYIPSFLAIIVYLFKQGNIPKTITEMYELLILHTIHRHLKKIGSISSDMNYTNIKNIPDIKVQATVKKLLKLAFVGLKEDKRLFSNDEINKEFPDIKDNVEGIKGFGLLQVIECSSGKENAKFGFRCYAMQDYLAAYYIFYHLSDTEQLSEMNRIFWKEKFYHMWIWFSRITRVIYSKAFSSFLNSSQSLLTNCLAENASWNENLSQLKLLQEISEDKRKCLHLYECFQEARITKKPYILERHYIENILNKAKEEETAVKVQHAKILFCGFCKAGKTSLIHFLKDIPPPDEYKSTDVGHSEQVVARHQVDIMDTKWKELNKSRGINKLTRQLINYLNDKTKVKNDNKSESEDESESDTESEPKNEFDQNLIQSSNSVSGSNHPINEGIISLSTEYIQVTTDSTDNANKISKIEKDIVSKAVSEAAKESNDTAHSEITQDTWKVLTLLDTGGQPEFLNLLPALSTFTSVTFVVLDISKKELIAQHSDPNYQKVKMDYGCEHFLKSVISAIKYSTKSTESIRIKKLFAHRIKSPTTEDHSPEPAICFIGTHADVVKEKNLASIPEKINSEIYKLVIEVNKNGELYFLTHSGDQYLFKVNNKLAGSDTPDPIANTLRNIVNGRQSLQDTYTIPITWLILELELQDQSVAYLEFKEVKKISDRIMPNTKKMTDDDLKAALNFFHAIGALLYFDEVEGLNEYVIVKINWLFEILTRLSSVALLGNVDNYCSSTISDSFINDGIFNKELLEQLKLDDCIEKELFLELLQYFKIAVMMSNDANNKEYFMPCVLKKCEWTKEDQVKRLDEFGKQKYSSNDSDTVKPLLITFKSYTIPRGLFCYLIVELLQLSDERWKFDPYCCKERGGEKCRFADLISFRVTNKTGDFHVLSLFDRIFYLELQVRGLNVCIEGVVCSIYYDVKNIVSKCIRNICCNQFGWDDDVKLQYGFSCECHLGDHHLVLFSDINNTNLQCERKLPYVFNSSNEVWLKKISIENVTTNHEITRVHSEEDAVREFNVKLLKNLPLDNPIFFAMADKAKLFPLGADNEIQAKSTRAEKVTYYIQHVLKPGAKEYLPTLLKIMKDSESSDVVNLANDIQTFIKPEYNEDGNNHDYSSSSTKGSKHKWKSPPPQKGKKRPRNSSRSRTPEKGSKQKKKRRYRDRLHSRERSRSGKRSSNSKKRSRRSKEHR